MNGLDQVVVVLWFLPVFLYLILPLIFACSYPVISFFLRVLASELGELISGDSEEQRAIRIYFPSEASRKRDLKTQPLSIED